ncbi:hypothetical protein MLD38_008990 [Melastoma candidum]|uniref:Uncharacterized protein n=1 Tax=Melastoma candidum TaxID=119954 RepID=A0ACB9RVQ8_9MYRT|nr:hypothetical protein MLD38_008990 [Melastoma candidum]
MTTSSPTSLQLRLAFSSGITSKPLFLPARRPVEASSFDLPSLTPMPQDRQRAAGEGMSPALVGMVGWSGHGRGLCPAGQIRVAAMARDYPAGEFDSGMVGAASGIVLVGVAFAALSWKGWFLKTYTRDGKLNKQEEIIVDF